MPSVRRLSAIALALLVIACRERNPAFMPDAVTTSGASGGSSSGAGTLGESSSGGSSSVGSSESGSSSEPTTDATATTSGGDGDVPYASCNDGESQCPRGWDDCVSVDDPPGSWCSHHCAHADDCEVPPTGDAEVVCAGPSGHDCALDCSRGQTCPDGMACETLFEGVVRCIWPA